MTDQDIHSLVMENPRYSSPGGCGPSHVQSAAVYAAISIEADTKIIKDLLRDPLYWGSDLWGALRHLEDCLNDHPQMYKRVIIGTDDYTQITFIEEILHSHILPITANFNTNVQVILFLLRVPELDQKLLEAVYQRNPIVSAYEDKYHPLMSAMLQRLKPDLYRWLLEKLVPILQESNYQVPYMFASVEHILITEEYMDLNPIEVSKSIEVVDDVLAEDVAKYGNWLITSGRICSMTALVVCGIIWEVRDADLISNILLAYTLAEEGSMKSLRRFLIRRCLDEGLEDFVKDILERMGQCGYFSDRGEVINLTRETDDVSAYIWSRCGIDPRKIVFDLLYLDTDDATTKRALRRILQTHEFYRVISRFCLVMIDFVIARNSIISADFLEYLVIGRLDYMDPPLIAQLTRILCMGCRRNLLRDLMREISYLPDPLSYRRELVRMMKLSFNELCRQVISNPTMNNAEYDTCVVIFDMIGKELVLDLDMLLKVITQTSQLTLARSVLAFLQTKASHSIEELNFTDKCISSLFDKGVSSRYLQEVLFLAGDISFKTLLRTNNPFRYEENPIFLEKFKTYISSHPEEYLRAVINQLSLGLLETSIVGDNMGIRYEGKKLILKQYTFISAIRSCGGIIMKQEITFIPTCASCTERLPGELYTNAIGPFGVYYCRQCADSIIQASLDDNIVRVECPVCITQSESLVVLDCLHVCCDSCLSALAKFGSVFCPLCRVSISSDNTVQISADEVISRFLSSS